MGVTWYSLLTRFYISYISYIKLYIYIYIWNQVMMMMVMMMMISHICSHPDYIIHQWFTMVNSVYDLFLDVRRLNHHSSPFLCGWSPSTHYPAITSDPLLHGFLCCWLQLHFDGWIPKSSFCFTGDIELNPYPSNMRFNSGKKKRRTFRCWKFHIPTLRIWCFSMFFPVFPHFFGILDEIWPMITDHHLPRPQGLAVDWLSAAWEPWPGRCRYADCSALFSLKYHGNWWFQMRLS